MASKDVYVLIYGLQSDDDSEVWEEFDTSDEAIEAGKKIWRSFSLSDRAGSDGYAYVGVIAKSDCGCYETSDTRINLWNAWEDEDDCIKAFVFPGVFGSLFCFVDLNSPVPVKDQLPDEVRDLIWIPGGYTEDDLKEVCNLPTSCEEYDGEFFAWTELRGNAVYSVDKPGHKYVEFMVLQHGDNDGIGMYRCLWAPTPEDPHYYVQDICPASAEDSEQCREALLRGEDPRGMWEDGLGNAVGATDETMSVQDIADLAEEMAVRAW